MGISLYSYLVIFQNFEVAMTASEFTDNDAFVKYDQRNGGWEEMD